jgi:hypothetical protein
MISRDLADIIDSLHRERQTGVLSVSVRSDNNQLKFFFRSGTVYYVTYSTCRNLECLVRLGALTAERGFFLLGAKVDTPHPITLSTKDIIDQVRKLNKTIEWNTADAAGGGRPSAVSGVPMAAADQVSKLEDDLLASIGPVGQIVFEQALQSCGILRDVAIPKKTFQELVRAISQQIPDEQRKKFLSMHAF